MKGRRKDMESGLTMLIKKKSSKTLISKQCFRKSVLETIIGASLVRGANRA